MIFLIGIILATFFSAIIVTNFIIPPIVSRMHQRKLIGPDMNKLDKPLIAEMGGIGVIFGFSCSIMVAIFIFSYLNHVNLNLTFLLAGFSTVVLIGFIGIVDDIIGWKKGIRQYQHALFPLFAALPLMAIKVGFTSMQIPGIGVVSFGILYSLILIPIGVTGAANAFNMLGGFNGLEAGLGAIISATLLIIAFFYGSIEAAILMAAMLGALLAFLKFNWFPAKIFPGDAVTLMMGAAVASAAIIGNMEKVAIVLIAIYFIELVFKARHKFQSECFGIPQKDGTLAANPKGGSFTHWIMRRGRFTEKQVVLKILAIQVIISIIVFVLFWMNYALNIRILF